jgi:heavy metal efflux system protein
VVVGGMLLGPVMLLVVVPALRMVFMKEERPRKPEPKPRSGRLPDEVP